jgi:hypothetical protein
MEKYHFWGDDYPLIKKLDGPWVLICHPNGPAICNGDTIAVIDSHDYESPEMGLIKRKAQTAYREWSWPVMKIGVDLPVFK